MPAVPSANLSFIIVVLSNGIRLKRGKYRGAVPEFTRLPFKIPSGVFRNRPQLCHDGCTDRVRRLHGLNGDSELDQLRKNVGVVLAYGESIGDGFWERGFAHPDRPSSQIT